MGARRIYVDIDDVLSQTIESLIDLLEVVHARRVEVEEVLHFDLAKSFALNNDEVGDFMRRAHSDDSIESIEPTKGAVDVLREWKNGGDGITLVTGRPPSTHAASRRWLERHFIAHDDLHHLDKWQRPDWNESKLPAIRFEDLHAFAFDFAVEDSLDTAVRLVEDFGIPVALMDRPWNRSVEALPTKTRSKLVRCSDWMAVAAAFA